jgi:putative membrane protein
MSMRRASGCSPLPALLAMACYLGGVASERRRGRPWPARRIAAWTAGIGVLVTAQLIGSVPAAGGALVTHMAVHVLVGMLTPLLLVLAAPVTLALRSLAIVPARRLARVLRSRPVAVLTHPVVAAALNLAPLWWLIQPETVDRMGSDVLLHAFVSAHLLIAGSLFTASIVGIDPSPHRAPFRLRAAVLVCSIAVHAVLPKLLVASGPDGVPGAELESAARVMYTGGDLVELALVTVFCLQWYRSARPRRRATSITVAAVRRR